MSVYDELTKWVSEKKLPFWERYALDLVISGEDVGQDEIDQMVVFLLEDGGIMKKEAPRPSLVALSEGPKSDAGTHPGKILLRGVSKTRNINALAPDQTLEFGPQLTAVFGANSSGKSGYARLLANAGFSRGDREVLPDISTSSKGAAPGEAVFHFEQNGQVVDIPFSVDDQCPEMEKFYVHDTVSITRQLTDENEFSFSPFGLGFLGSLAEICDRVAECLDVQVEAWSRENPFLEKFDGLSIVRDQIETLSKDTDIPALVAIANISDEDKAEKKRLEKQIAILRSRSPQERIKKITVQLADLNAILRQLVAVANAMVPQTTKSIETHLANLKLYKLQAKNLSVEQFTTELFSQVGSDVWQRFIDAAHELATAERESETYPESGDHCLLCRQKLRPAEIELLHKFWNFLQDDSRQKIRGIETALSGKRNELVDIETGFFVETSVGYRLLETKSPETLEKILTYVRSAALRKKQILGIIDSRKVVELDPLPECPIPTIREFIVSLNEQIRTLKQSDPAKEIEKLEDQYRTFTHREKLGPLVKPIIKYIGDLMRASRAQRLRPNTNHISLMQGRLFDKLVSEEYITRFRDNLSDLGRDLPVEIRTRNNKGTSLKEIRVQKAEYEAVRILCDGEKRIASLADFLTEVSLDPEVIGIALDDPVTSLDIEWKEDVAARLVEEAKTRQTIIFTHDLHFLYLLKQHAGDEKVDLQCHWIIRGEPNGPPGHVYLNNSPALEKDYKSCVAAEEHLKRAKAVPPQEQEQILRNGFSALRTSYEALVMYELFAGVVERFQERTRIDLLDNVFLDKDAFEMVREKHGVLSRYMEGHLHSDDFGAKKPTLETLKQEIEGFKALKARIKAAKKE